MSNKKKVLLGVGLAALILGLIIIGLYATYRAAAYQSATSVAVPEENDMRLDVKVENGLTQPDSVPGVTEPESTASGGQNTANSNVEVTVDGTPIDVPENGSVHKEITTEDGSTSIDVSSESNSSSGVTRTRSSINVDSDSSVQIRSETRE